MKIEINLKIILFAVLFLILRQIDLYMIFIISITLHEVGHLIMGILVRITSQSIFIKSIRSSS